MLTLHLPSLGQLPEKEALGKQEEELTGFQEPLPRKRRTSPIAVQNEHGIADEAAAGEQS